MKNEGVGRSEEEGSAMWRRDVGDGEGRAERKGRRRAEGAEIAGQEVFKTKLRSARKGTYGASKQS